MDIESQLSKIAKSLTADDPFSLGRNTGHVMSWDERQKFSKYLKGLIDHGLSLPDSGLVDSKEVESVGALRFPDPTKNGKWRIFVTDEEMKRKVKALIKAKDRVSGGFKPSDLKKPAMLDSKGRARWQ